MLPSDDDMNSKEVAGDAGPGGVSLHRAAALAPGADCLAGDFTVTSRILVVLAGVLVFANCLINSPSRFSPRHATDQTLLRPIVTALGLDGRFGTARGVEVRNLIFHGGAAIILAVCAVSLIVTRRRPRYAFDDLLDFRARAGSPYFWWALLVVASGISSFFSHAPDVCQGQSIIRLLWLAWWWPLAAMLAARDARTLATTLLAALATTAALAMAYHLVRGGENPWAARLSYPLGNELWLAACLLPGVPVGVGLALSSWGGRESGAGGASAAKGRKLWTITSWTKRGAMLVAVAVLVAALLLTRSRSALAGLAAAGAAYVCLLMNRKARSVALLAVLLVGVAGAVAVNRLRSEGGTALRSHSIRTRLNYEWPYALRLMMDKPVVGHGDGAYSMLAGQLARDDQVDDPSTLRFDGQSWTGHAHNEYLELAADLGVAGSGAYIAAIILTLYYAGRFCDRRRGATADAAQTSAGPADRSAERHLAAGLAAALVGLAADQFGEPSVREPGGPAVFLTVWALAWAVVRRERRERVDNDASARLSNPLLRLFGAAILSGSAWLAFVAVQDWRAARARAAADALLADGRYEQAIAQADFAADRLLDPFQRNLARLIAIRARSAGFDAALAESPDAPPSAAAMQWASDAAGRLGRLRADVPRFLQLSRLEADLALNLARAAQRRGDVAALRENQARFIQAVEQQRADEPFASDIVAALWRLRPDAPARQRLDWLRPLLRGGFVDEAGLELIGSLPALGDLPGTMADLTNVAVSDSERPRADWHDRFSPESLRLAAYLARLGDENERAMALAARAVAMYERAGPGLFAARAAALAEWVECDLAVHGGAHANANLRRLADAASLLWDYAADPSATLPGPLGRLRLRVLESAGRQPDAAAQRAALGE